MIAKPIKSNIIIYNDGELELDISVQNETIWLTQSQLSDIFEKDQSVISRHINNIFRDNEVDEKSNMQKMHIANSDKPINLYRLNIEFKRLYKDEYIKWISAFANSESLSLINLKDAIGYNLINTPPPPLNNVPKRGSSL